MSDSADPVPLAAGPSVVTAWQTLLERIPYARYLGLDIRPGQTGMEVHLPYREALIGNSMLPALHGGVIGALIEITACVAAQSHDPGIRRPRILNCNIDYLRSARTQSTFASAEIIRQGRRTGLVQVDCRQEGTSAPIASGRVQLLILLADRPPRGST